ncbi:hypothetical protein GLOTRDRAFT_134307 [Gloeophyllum trabeum ATCC 11539]|uniref:DUF6532 domain-containing protein n=2 Tax=Gloeophyllum trabeum (strain ATCC 11539 / FP-39264 / Madison 617) TaxID=670483 RepID=S7R6P0_GLOTA|nr:uncharacterized protein GLOTRDRAFT_134307 [Gloeophyllum trabeum ATCC 11539]EPQ50050.1 hypothetical protein GLOTRDRAFT_134307 [Gloeophyllum trabeum ATCC 11539]
MAKPQTQDVDVSVPSSALTNRAQKAAATRARNKVAQEAKDALELQKPKVDRNAKAKAVANAVWMKKTEAAPNRKRAGSGTMPTIAKEAKRSKKSEKAADQKAEEPARRYAAPLLNASDAESASEEEEQHSDDAEHVELEGELLESDDERLMGLAPAGMAHALGAEAASWQGAEDDSDPVLHVPPKYQRKSFKSRSSSQSSFDSSYISVPEDDDSAIEDTEAPVPPLSVAKQPSVRPKASKPSDAARRYLPGSADLFDSDEDVVVAHPYEEAPGPGMKATNRGRKKTAENVYTDSSRPVKSKRKLIQESEAPRWRNSATGAGHEQAAAAPAFRARSTAIDSTVVKHDVCDVVSQNGRGAHYDMTELVYNPRGTLNLTAQTREIQEVVRIAIDIITVGILMDEAYPDMGDKIKLGVDACADAARELGDDYLPILQKLKDKREKVFRHSLGALPVGRISLTRGEIRTVAVAQVVGHYGLTQGCGEYAAGLLQGQRYIFPGDLRPGGRFKSKEPYRHPAVLNVLQQAIFTGRSSFASGHIQLFESSSKDYPDEKEVPLAMLALVSTAIHAAIDEWSSGTVMQLDFSGNRFAAVYTAHKDTLKHIQKTSPKFYHETMAYLFKTARGATYDRAGGDVVNSAITLMDLSGLD